MEKIFKKDLEQKIRNIKRNIKVINIKTSYVKLQDNFDEVYNEIEEVIDYHSSYYSSYDIAQSIEAISLAPIIHIIFYE